METEQLGEILDNIEIGVLLVDSGKKVSFCNRTALKMLGKRAEEPILSCHSLLFGFETPCKGCFFVDGAAESVEIQPKDSDRTLECRRSMLPSGSLLVQLKDITALKSLQADIESSTVTDFESGLIKPAFIGDHLQREMSRARRFGGNISLIMLRITDLAHPGVNGIPKIVARILRGIGEILGSDLRAYDLAFRYDLDTFAVILPGEDIDGAMTVAHRLYSKIKNLGIQRARIGVSVMGSATSPQAVIESAQRALYIAEHTDEPIATT